MTCHNAQVQRPFPCHKFFTLDWPRSIAMRERVPWKHSVAECQEKCICAYLRKISNRGKHDRGSSFAEKFGRDTLSR